MYWIPLPNGSEAGRIVIFCHQEVDIWRLQSQLFQDEDWTGWLLHQTNFLALDRQWRDKEKDRFVSSGRNDGKQLHNFGDDLDEMEHQASRGHGALSWLQLNENHELLSYSFW
jgi:hypothetical protein